MVTEEQIYIKILLWIFGKQHTGFTNQELQREFNLDENQQIWVQKVFRPASTEERLFDVLVGTQNSPQSHMNTAIMVITGKGIASAIDYLDLKEARESGADAKKLALRSIWVAIGLGVVQILIALIQVYLK